MEYFASSESYRPAGAALRAVSRAVSVFLKAALATSSLASLDCTVRYVPIVMPESLHARYSARSKLRKKERLYDCAPILDYDVFLGTDFEAQLREYLRGLALAVPHLPAFGASAEQIAEFNQILDGAVKRIMLERPDLTRH